MKPVVVFGIGEVGEVIQYYIDHESDRRVAAFTVDASYVKESQHMGRPVVAFEEVTSAFPPSEYDMYVAVSFRGLNKHRAEKVAQATLKGYELIGHISPRAVVWSGFVLHPNTFIMENNVIQPYVRVGRDVIMWSGNHVGHHTSIEDHCFIASQAVISGAVVIGESSFIGVNATIRDNVKLGKRNVIGAGALILKDTEDEAVYIGPTGTLLPKKSSELRNI
jgi:sugar O-acyltransferase (sialic acid O-acetyltransferase NeuD family)